MVPLSMREMSLWVRARPSHSTREHLHQQGQDAPSSVDCSPSPWNERELCPPGKELSQDFSCVLVVLPGHSHPDSAVKPEVRIKLHT